MAGPTPGGTTVGGAVGDFDSFGAGSYGLFDTGNNGCTSVAAGASGKVALINRGACTFSQKNANAKAAGAIGVIVVNNVAGDPIAMARTVGFDDDIPAVMISKTDGATLRTANPATVTIAASFSEFLTANGDILAGFSSQGPTNVDYAIKPDLTSVGVNVLSSIACTNGASCGGEGDWASFSGTSMSSPHVAGSAAVLRGLHPTWTPAQIKSALVNTSNLVVKNAFDASTTVGPQAQGAGREDLAEAATTDATFWPTSASFGRISSSNNNPTSIGVRVSNLTGVARTFDVTELKFTPAGGVLAAFNGGSISSGDSRITTPSSITVPANSSATLTITVNAGLANGTVAQGWIQLGGSGDEYQVAYWVEVAP